VSNTRKLKPRGASGRPLPRCADCHSQTVIVPVGDDGPVIIRIEHDPPCPVLRGVVPSLFEKWARAEALTGRPVLYLRDQV
jgi:hypothetical protein